MFTRLTALSLLCLAALVPAGAAQDLPDAPANFVINLRDADIRALAEQVSEITGRTLILDPAVAGDVTVISAQPLDPAGVWDLFQSVLRVQGYAALRSGTIWRVIPQEGVREAGGELRDEIDPGRLDVVTRLVKLRNFPVVTAVGALRPLVANFGYIEALPETNTLVITDNAENVSRIEEIARTLDEGDGSQVSTIPVRNGDAGEIASALENVLSAQSGGLPPRVAIDSRANVILVRGDPDMTSTIRQLVAELDQPGVQGPSVVPVTRLYRLQYAEATSLAEVLRGVIGAQGGATSAVARSLADTAPTPVQNPRIAGQFGAGPPQTVGLPGQAPLAVAVQPFIEPQAPQLAFAPPPVSALSAEDITIQPAPEINAVVIRARAEVQADLAQLVAQLDQRRPQVLIEAAIVEISGDISEQLGIQLGFGEAAPPAGFAATSFSPVGLQLNNILGLLGVRASAAIAPQGLSAAVSRRDEYGILLQALGQSSKANLLSTPSITTLDNQAASIIVGQNVPFRTGSFSSGGDGVNPFTTIERQDVGITLRVVPRVSQGDVVQLEVSQEVSSLVGAVAGAADIVTNRRLIQTTVLADNGGTIVLGGLITDDRQSTETQVPGLGDIPVIGRLFSSNSEGGTKRTLFVFLRPTILRTRTEIGRVSADRFQRLRAIEARPRDTPPPLLAEPKPVRRLPLEINGLY